MSIEPVQDDRRTRRRLVLLWFGAGLAALAFFTAGAVTVGRDRSDPAATIDADGTGTAPVLAAPPTDPDLEPGTAGPSSIDAGTSAARPTPAASRSLSGDATTDQSAQGPARQHGVRLQLTSTLSAPLRPGFSRTLHVRVRNPNYFAVQLYRVDVRVLASPAPGCLSSWVRTGRYRYAGGTPTNVAARSSTYVDLPIQLVNLVDVDQNACQRTAFPLNLTGIAVDPR